MNHITTIEIPPKHGGIITSDELNLNDVLCGRGGSVNAKPGNIQFRTLADQHKNKYFDVRTRKLDKSKIAGQIIQTIRSMNPPGRFLEEVPNPNTSKDAPLSWVEIGDKKAIRKAGQLMRENANKRKRPEHSAEPPSVEESALQIMQIEADIYENLALQSYINALESQLMRERINAISMKQHSAKWAVPSLELSAPFADESRIPRNKRQRMTHQETNSLAMESHSYFPTNYYSNIARDLRSLKSNEPCRENTK